MGHVQNTSNFFIVNRFLFFLLFLIGCLRPDKPIQLSPPGPITSIQVSLGPQYEQQVFFSLSNFQFTSHSIRLYDFRIDFALRRIWLNTAKYMFVYPTNDTVFSKPYAIPNAGKTTDHYLYPDSFALDPLSPRVYLIDRGEPYHTTNRWYKLKIITFDSIQCHLRVAPIDATQSFTDYRLQRDRAHLYLNLESGILEEFPDSEAWDLLFTQYTHTYDTLPQTDPAKFYLVRGVLLHPGTQAAMLTFPSEEACNEAFQAFAIPDTASVSLKNVCGVIGFDWKTFDFTSGLYVVDPKRFYLIKDRKGYYYKLRFYDFYDAQGKPGSPAFQTQRL